MVCRGCPLNGLDYATGIMIVVNKSGNEMRSSDILCHLNLGRIGDPPLNFCDVNTRGITFTVEGGHSHCGKG